MYRFQTRQESQSIEQRLWLFSLEMWRHDTVQKGLLALQDEYGANINVLLFAAWLARDGRSFNPQAFTDSGLSDWNATMTAPLRTLRRQAKTVSTELYQCLKSGELAAERHEQKLLAASLEEHAPVCENTSQELLLRANLVSYLHTLAARDVSAALHHCETLLQQTLLYTPPTTQETDSP